VFEHLYGDNPVEPRVAELGIGEGYSLEAELISGECNHVWVNLKRPNVLVPLRLKELLVVAPTCPEIQQCRIRL
jgi:hypothetical protein